MYSSKIGFFWGSNLITIGTRRSFNARKASYSPPGVHHFDENERNLFISSAETEEAKTKKIDMPGHTIILKK